jgi:protein TonB
MRLAPGSAGKGRIAMRWPWICSSLVHGAALAGLAFAGLGGAFRNRREIPVVISTDVRPEPPVRFESSRVIFSQPVVREPEERRPEHEPDQPEPIEEIPDPPEPVRPEPRRVSAPCHAIPKSLLRPVPRERPEREAPSPDPSPVSTDTGPTPPVPVAGNPPPRYPESARRRGVEGTVLVRLVISGRGEVTGAEVIESSGSDLLDQAALGALRQWRFTPGRWAEHIVHYTVVVPVRFALEGVG